MNDDQLHAELQRRARASDAPDLLPAVRSAIDSRPAPAIPSRLTPLAGLVGVLAVLVLLVVALPRLGPGDAQPSPSDGPVSTTDRSGDFSLTITATRSHYTPGEPIEIEASLVYDGDQGEAMVGGSNTLIGFGVERVDGTLRMDPAWDASCTRHTLAAGMPVVEPFSKSGGYSDTDPDAAFWRDYFSDPQLHLPTGPWRIQALATFGLDECRSVRTLEASILIHVGPEQEPEASSEAPTPDVAPTPQTGPRTIACPPVRGSLGDVAPTVVDGTGLVLECRASRATEGGSIVANPDGNRSVLQIDWSGSSCDAAATLSLSAADRGYELVITPLSGPCLMLRAPYSIQLELREPIAAEDVQVTRGEPAEAGPAWWELAAHERPTAESTTLDVVVYERDCAGGQSPDGRIVGPEIEYDIGVISITFHVEPLSGAGDCQLAPGVPMTVQLSEPLGDRRINDGGIGADAVIEASDSLLALETSRVDELAYERFEAMAGGDGCLATTITDRYVPTQQELEAAVNELEGEDGLIEYGGYVADDWLSAARAFGAIEAYGGRPKPWYIVRPIGDSHWLSTLVPTEVSGRTLWSTGDSSTTLVDCPNESPPPSPSTADEDLRTIQCGGPGLETTVVDRAEAVDSCVSLAPTAQEMASVSSPMVVDPDGDESELRVLGWISCLPSLEVTMMRSVSGRWEVELLDSGGILLCARFVAIDFALARPAPAHQVDVILITA